MRQLHSCVSYSINDHFADKPAAVRELFDALLVAAQLAGPVRQDAVKSGIKLATTSHFAMVSPQHDGLRMELLMDGPPTDPRVLSSLQLGPHKYAWRLKLTAPEDIDEQLERWLGRAHELSMS